MDSVAPKSPDATSGPRREPNRETRGAISGGSSCGPPRPPYVEQSAGREKGENRPGAEKGRKGARRIFSDLQWALSGSSRDTPFTKMSEANHRSEEHTSE